MSEPPSAEPTPGSTATRSQDRTGSADRAIWARGLWKAYREDSVTTEVLLGVDIEVARGELVAIVGPSGSGKSTLLHLLGGLDRPDRGSIEVAGHSLATLDVDQLAAFRNRTIGFVFQFHQLLPDFNSVENVMMPGLIGGLPRKELQEKTVALLEEVGLGGRKDYFPSQLSGGERQRVALCRALILEPPVLLADEPTGNLDPASGSAVLERLFELQAQLRTTTILVTHNPVLAERCGRVLTLESGVLRPASGAE